MNKCLILKDFSLAIRCEGITGRMAVNVSAERPEVPTRLAAQAEGGGKFLGQGPTLQSRDGGFFGHTGTATDWMLAPQNCGLCRQDRDD